MKKQYSAPAIKVRAVKGESEILNVSLSSISPTSGLSIDDNDNSEPTYEGEASGMSAGAKRGLWDDATEALFE